MVNFYSLFIHGVYWNADFIFCSCYEKSVNVIIVRVNGEVKFRFDIS